MRTTSEHPIYFANLDSIRFIAAMMVFATHTIVPYYSLLATKNNFVQKLLATLSSGETGVSIFFVLSGFIITYWLVHEYETNKKISVSNFYLKRVLRIWPLYYSVVLFSFFIYPQLKSLLHIDTQLVSNVYYHLTFLSNFDIINACHNNQLGSTAMSQNITWSVSIEEQFYLIWPLLFAFIPPKFFFHAIITVIAFSIGFRIYYSADPIILYFHSFSVATDLGIGGLFALLSQKSERFRSFFSRGSSIHHCLFFLITFLLLFYKDVIFKFEYGVALSRLFTAIAFATIIAAQSFTQTNSVFNLGKIEFARRMGKYTYGIYMLHPIAIITTDIIMRVGNLPRENFINISIFVGLSFIFTIILALLSYYTIESYFLKLKNSLVSK